MSRFVRSCSFVLAATLSFAARADEPSLIATPTVAAARDGGRNKGLLVTGLSIFGVSYSMNAMWGAVSDDWRPAVPIAGPIIIAAQSFDGKSYLSRGVTTLLVMDASVQLGGAVMAIIGAITHKPLSTTKDITIAPMASGSGAGVQIGGQF